MESKRLEAAFEELRARRRADRSRDLSQRIEDLLKEDWSTEGVRALRGELVGEYQRHKRYAAAERVLHSEIESEPLEPYHSIALAEHFHYYDVDLQRSLEHIAQAVAKARADGKFMYQALGVQARLAVETQDWKLLEATLVDLAQYEHKPGFVDVFPETDFVARIPPGVVPDRAIEDYVRRVEYLRSIGYSTMHGARGENRDAPV